MGGDQAGGGGGGGAFAPRLRLPPLSPAAAAREALTREQALWEERAERLGWSLSLFLLYICIYL
jgi:hypothetical protein